MTKMKRTLTKFQEAQLAFALSNDGKFCLAVQLVGKTGTHKFRHDAIVRCWDAFLHEGITEHVREGNLTFQEFTCKARDYVDTFHCTPDYLYR